MTVGPVTAIAGGINFSVARWWDFPLSHGSSFPTCRGKSPPFSSLNSLAFMFSLRIGSSKATRFAKQTQTAKLRLASFTLSRMDYLAQCAPYRSLPPTTKIEPGNMSAFLMHLHLGPGLFFPTRRGMAFPHNLLAEEAGWS